MTLSFLGQCLVPNKVCWRFDRLESNYGLGCRHPRYFNPRQDGGGSVSMASFHSRFSYLQSENSHHMVSLLIFVPGVQFNTMA